MRSDLAVRPNLMPDEPAYLPPQRFFPGDLVDMIYPEMTDTRVIDRELTEVQRVELSVYVKCTACRMRNKEYCTH